MRIVFMGTPAFAVPSLQTLLNTGHQVTGVYCQSDKPKGRGHKLSAPPVKELAQAYDIPVFQPKTMRSAGEPAPEVMEQLRLLAPDLIVVAAYGKILPRAVLELPRYGCINVHASLLPKYRGAGPIQWAVINGERVTGVTTMQMADGIDTGDMLLRASLEIGENETADELYDRLSELGGELLRKTLLELEAGTLCPQKQKDEDSTHAPMLTKELSMLDFSSPASKLHHLILGLSSWPCAETVLELPGEERTRLKIYRSELVSMEKKGEPGTILSDKEFLVACGEGVLRFTEVQGEGSRRMNGADFLRGRRIPIGARLVTPKP